MSDLLDPKSHEPILAQISVAGAERNVLAAILHDPNAIYDVSLYLKDRDFSNSINSKIYSNMILLMSNGATINASTLTAVMRKTDGLSPEEAEKYLSVIDKTNTINMDLDFNIERVRSASTKRAVYSEALSIMGECAQDDFQESPDSFIGRQQQKLLDVSISLDVGDKVIKLGNITGDLLEKSAANPRDILGLRTPFPELDKQMLGLRPETLTIFTATAKGGKTTYMLNLATYIAVLAAQQVPILFIGTEMTDTQIATRLLSYISKVPEKRILTGRFIQEQSQMDAVIAAEKKFQSAPFYHAYLPGFQPQQVASLARKYKIKEKVGAIFFDYIKMPKGADAGKMATELGKVATMLKDLSGELSVPVVTAAQLNRENLVRGSDELRHYCDYMFNIRRKTPEELEEERGELGNTLITAEAARSGANYHCHYQFDGDTLTFTEILNQESDS